MRNKVSLTRLLNGGGKDCRPVTMQQDNILRTCCNAIMHYYYYTVFHKKLLPYIFVYKK